MNYLINLIVNRILKTTRQEAAEREGGRKAVTYNRGVRLLAMLFPLLPVSLLYLVLEEGLDDPGLVYGITGGFFLLAGVLIYMVLLTRLEFDEHAICYASPFRGECQISWATVTGGGYSAMMNGYWIATADIGRIWVSPMQHGWADILWLAGEKLLEQTGEDPFMMHSKG